jgi:hypothetical protein
MPERLRIVKPSSDGVKQTGLKTMQLDGIGSVDGKKNTPQGHAQIGASFVRKFVLLVGRWRGITII